MSVAEPERLLSPRQLASYLNVSVATVYDWRHRRCGPPGFRVGKHQGYTLLPMTVEVRPLRSAVDSGLSYEVEVGEELGVQRDRESTLHRNAVMLVAGAQPLAYLPVDAARALALEMDSGMRVVAEVDEIRATSDGRRTSLLITLHESGYGADTDIA